MGRTSVPIYVVKACQYTIEIQSTLMKTLFKKFNVLLTKVTRAIWEITVPPPKSLQNIIYGHYISNICVQKEGNCKNREKRKEKEI